MNFAKHRSRIIYVSCVSHAIIVRLLKQEEQPVSADDSVASICEHKDGEGEDFKRKKRRLDPVWDLTENSGPLGEDV